MLKAYRLKFLSKSTLVRSYTIFGAICWAYRLMGNNLEELFYSFLNNKPFIISSPFPIVENGKNQTLLFPKPILPISFHKDKESKICQKVKRKLIKKAKYVSFNVFKQVIEGKVREEKELNNTEKFSEINGAIFVKEEEILFHNEEKSLFNELNNISVRNRLNRVSQKSEDLFTEEYYLFSDKWFLIKFYDKSFYPAIEECFKFIEDTGLGANKNLGWGKVKIEELKGFEKKINYLDSRIKSDNKMVTLSPTIPKEGSISIEESTYQYEVYKSPIDTTFGERFIWKEKVIYLTEGSILKKENNNTWIGQLKEVSGQNSNKKIYQYGIEFPISLGGV